MLTIALLTLFIIAYLFWLAQAKFKIIENQEIKTNRQYSNGSPVYESKTVLHYKFIVVPIVALIVIFFQPYKIGKIEAGYKGMRVNLIGDNRGASNIDEVSGFVFYNKYTQELHEVPLDQNHIEYKDQVIVARGGFPCTISPSFNYSVKNEAAADMFTNLRTAYRTGGLKNIEQGWLKNAILGAINDVSNTFVIDDIFNNRQKYEQAIVIEANKRVGKWFTISQLKTNILPPQSIRLSIEAKATAIQAAITSEAQANSAKADAQRKIQLAKGDSADLVIRAQAEARSVKLKQMELSPLYIEYIKAQKWDGVNSSTVVGSGAGTGVMLNVTK